MLHGENPHSIQPGDSRYLRPIYVYLTLYDMALDQDLGEPSELDTEQPPSRHLEKALEFVISYYDINL